MDREISRRKLLSMLAVTAGSVTLCGDFAGVPGSTPTPDGVEETGELDKLSFLPLVKSTGSAPPESRVVHAHAPEATHWDSGMDYWNHVDQDVVNAMVDQGLTNLTGSSTVSDAWQALLPSYQPGQGIAIKVNFNHDDGGCEDYEGKIAALIEPVNAVVRSLKQIGVQESDIWVYDAIRRLPDRFVEGCLYGGVRFFDRACREPAGFESTDPDAYVTFSPPSGTPPPIRISDVLIEATYLINMPIMRVHSGAGITLAFKNHFGTIDNPLGLHDFFFLPGYSALMDVYQNPHIQGKTVLTVGDGLIGAKRWAWPDPGWTSFGNETPSSLFFARDPVAVDSVMCDFLAAETAIPDEADDYLVLAADAGLGVFERGDPWGSGYTEIDYLKIEM